MEIDFDKEIDALLRKAARGPAEAASGEHLDADAISAFATGDLPPAARNAYTMHLAECDQCRKLLAVTASFAEESAADPSTNVHAVPVSSSWYKRYFGLPALAYTMGALALLLSGFIGYSLLQRSNESQNSEVSRVYEDEPQLGGPNAGQTEPYVAQSATNTSISNTANGLSNTSTSSTATSSNTMVANSAPAASGIGAANSSKSDGVTVQNAPPPPPAARPIDSPLNELPLNGRSTADLDTLKPGLKVMKEERARNETEKQSVMAQAPNDQKKMKDQAPAALMAGSAKAPEPRKDKARQLPNSMDSAEGMNVAPSVRTAGGKKFEQRNGIWYDTDYHSEKTKNVRRGTGNYIKLDAGLRSIADNIGGTVVIVWSGKAYRVQ